MPRNDQSTRNGISCGASKTGVNAEHLSVFWEAIKQMWDLDRSASRGLMTCRGLYVFSHDDELGNAPAHVLFDRIQIRRRDGVKAPRQFADYDFSVTDEKLDGSR